MSNFQTEMNRAVEGFVAQISELARRAALETLQASFGTGGTTKGRGAIALVPAAAEQPGRPRGTRGAKRSAEDLEALCARLASFVKSNPGLRIEQINKELGTVTKDLALPIRKLIAESRIATKGQKRSTAYFPGRRAGKN
jgi:hypothetical protein